MQQNTLIRLNNLKNAQSVPKLSGTVPHPIAAYYRFKTIPFAIKSFMRQFRAALKKCRQNGEPDLIIRVRGVRIENKIENLQMCISYGIENAS